ncbi:MAG: hypothetical protein K8T25_20145, partial [Planctomycetia bacterium]|nr:hypothetical protein [Planctomycetia bacterium]
MQLDKTFIAIRERDFLETLDLALQVIRAYFGPLFTALLAGIVPVAVGIHLLTTQMLGPDLEPNWRVKYTALMLGLVIYLAPLATAPATLFLGQATFQEKPNALKIGRDMFSSLPQLLLYLFLRNFWLMWALTSYIPFTYRPYTGEIVLLERNPLFAGKTKRITTGRRSAALHAGSAGDLFGRWVLTLLFYAGMINLLILAMWSIRQWVTGTANLDDTSYVIYLQISVW